MKLLKAADRRLATNASRYVLLMMAWLFSICGARADANGFGHLPIVRVPEPLAAILSAVAGGTFPPHSDYVRITYVSATGETLPSRESVFSAGAGTLTVVHSPPAEPGAIGYNVYSVQNNGGNGAGHVLQNVTPITIGTDYTEPVAGWAKGTRVPPSVNNALLPMPEAILPLTPTGGYIEAPVVNGARASLDLPRNDAPPSTEISITSASGALADQIGQPEDAIGSDGSSVLQTIGFAFNRDVSFDGLPSLKLTLPRDAKATGPFIVRLYDATSKTTIATMPAFTYDHLTFFGDYRSPVKMLAFRRYYAELIANSPFAISNAIEGAATTLSLPAVAGVSPAVHFPSGNVAPGSVYSIYASHAPPVGLPPIGGTDVEQTLYYASITVTGTVAYSGPATITVNLPATLARVHATVKLAAYDSQFSHSGWAVRLAATSAEGASRTFTTTLPSYIGWRQYGIALYVSNDRGQGGSAINTATTGRAAGHSPLVVVLGDSVSLLTIIPPSSTGCTPGWAPLPDCQYSKDPSRNWPGALGRLTGDDVINLSAQGTQTTVSSYAGASMLDLMVPQIPRNAQVVVCQCGCNDLALNAQSPATSARAAIITRAILERAPRARIVYIGIRCFSGCSAPAIDAWNVADKALAARYGAFVDLIPLAPAGASPAFPDGSHPSSDMAKNIAVKVAAAIASLDLPRL